VLSSTCPFCAIVSGSANADVVARFKSAIAFFPKDPATLGHTLVVPTDHLTDLWSLDAGIAAALSQIGPSLHRVQASPNYQLVATLTSTAVRTIERADCLFHVRRTTRPHRIKYVFSPD
jgi:Protein similar to CwfJ C-terminus 1